MKANEMYAVGDIYYHEEYGWGPEAYEVEFAQVTKVSEKSVWLNKIDSKVVGIEQKKLTGDRLICSP